MSQNKALLDTVELLLVLKPAFQRDIEKKAESALLALTLKQARQIAPSGAANYFTSVIDGLPVPALLKLAKKYDAHLVGRDAMPDAWLKAHLKKLILGEGEPARALKASTPPKNTKGLGKLATTSPAAPRPAKPVREKVIVNG